MGRINYSYNKDSYDENGFTTYNPTQFTSRAFFDFYVS